MEKLNIPEDIAALSRSSESLVNRHKTSFNLDKAQQILETIKKMIVLKWSLTISLKGELQ